MTKINLSFAALATAAMLVAAPAFAEKANAPAISPSHIQLAQADVKVRVGTTGKRTVVKKKVIVKRPTRDRAIDDLIQALNVFEVRGVKSNIPALVTVLGSDEFRGGHVHTGLIGELIK